MQLTAMNAPVRAALVGSRFSGGLTAPLAGSNSTTSRSPSASTAPAPQSCGKTYRTWTASTGGYQQRNPICSKAASPPATRCRKALSAAVQSASTLQPRSYGALVTTRSASSQAGQHAEAEPSASSSASSSVLLDWNTFFNLRASRRRYTLLSSIIASVGTTSAGITVLATQNLETIGAQLMGLDPIVVMVLGTASCGAAGWLAGPFLGNSIWRLIYRKYQDAFAIKDKEFYDRIKRFRVDPSAQSFSNPVPDYYGEKIGSVQGYRRWLKDQRAYNRKKRSFV